MTRQIDPDGPYMHGYRDAEEGNKRRCPYSKADERAAYHNGFTAALIGERSPL